MPKFKAKYIFDKMYEFEGEKEVETIALAEQDNFPYFSILHITKPSTTLQTLKL